MRENDENVRPIFGALLSGLQLGWAMNWMDRLRTSADEGLYSGRRSVVVV
jgi:hypothetical protein